MSKSKSKKSKKGKKEEGKKKSTSRTQERRQHARGIRIPILQARKEHGGHVAPRRNNRITESATKESRAANIKYVESG